MGLVVDESEFSWHEAMCHADLDNWGRAVELFHQAVELRPLGRPGARFNDLGYLLEALVEVEAWRDAEVTIENALPYVGKAGSTRTTVLLQGVTRRIDATKASPSLRDAARHLRDLLNAAGGVSPPLKAALRDFETVGAGAEAENCVEDPRRVRRGSSTPPGETVTRSTGTSPATPTRPPPTTSSPLVSAAANSAR
ncbi:MAG: hypothetical protein ACRDYA_08630 [Egibacteraceae bacterium]